MTIKDVTLDFFRNYAHLEVSFDPGVNVIVGENAQGKTNLIEAMAYLSSATSHRARYDRELIQFSIDRAFLKAEVFSRHRDYTLEAQLTRGARRKLWSNGVRLKSAGELSGLLTTVLFCPEDLYLIREGAGTRRKFLDSCICQLRPKYAAALAEYNRLHEQKMRILRDWEKKPSLLDTLDDYSLRMAQCGAILIHYRAHFIEKLNQTAPAIHADCSGGREGLRLKYDTVSTITDPLAPPRQLLGQLLDHQEGHRQAEIDSHACLTGPHRDEVLIQIDGNLARVFGSQGQVRTAALSLKMAARDIFYQDTGEWPVLLLDDVLSELDHRRQEYVLNRITSGQVFITCCEEETLTKLRAGRAFRIQGGRLVG